jgi:hypothetical protein
MILPETICLTGSSTFLRLMVVCTSTSQRYSETCNPRQKTKLTGISGVSKTYFGTQRLPTSCDIALLTFPTSSSVNFTPGFISKNSSTRSSSSSGLRCPTHTLSWISSGNRASSTLYTSALPNRTPEGFSTPSARPCKWTCFVAGSMEMKSSHGC